MKVELPQAQAARPLDPERAGRGGRRHATASLPSATRRSTAADLVQLVKLKIGDDLARVVHLRGDKEVAYGQMVAVLDQLATNGITHIAIVTERGKTSRRGKGRRTPPGARAAAGK